MPKVHAFARTIVSDLSQQSCRKGSNHLLDRGDAAAGMILDIRCEDARRSTLHLESERPASGWWDDPCGPYWE
jgi:hypothetical protein